MNLLNIPVKSISFADVQTFCATGEIEGIQLDYKLDLPSSGLAKHFAAFSNSRGGLIIIGVEEHTNGTPKAYDGIVFDSKLVDRIHQYAGNVRPIPLYEVHHTDEVNGKVFILVRIFEGDRPPYYVQNDANLYVRTGNITSLIDKASPDVTELLFGKKEKAEKARQIYISSVEKVYAAVLERAEKERHRLIAAEKDDIKRKAAEEGKPIESYSTRIFKGKVGTEVSMCSVLVQPFAPTSAITTPSQLKASIRDLQVDARYYHTFPSYNAEPIPQGMMIFEWDHNSGHILTEQLYGTGLVFYAKDILRQDEYGKKVGISGMASMLYSTLRAAANLYNKFGYQGGVKGFISLEDTTDVNFVQIVPDGWHGFFDTTKQSLLPEYKWQLDLDTSILNNSSSFERYYIDKVREFYWDLGFGEVREELVKAFLEKNLGWAP